MGGLEAIWGGQEGRTSSGGGGRCAAAWPLLDTFCESILHSRDLKQYLYEEMFTGGLQHAVPCFAGGGGSRTRCARSTAAPSQGCSVCRLCQARVHPGCNTGVSGVVRELLGFPLGCRRFFVGVVGRTSALLERSWSLLGCIWGGPGGGLGGLGAAFGGSGAVLGPSWPLLSPSSQFWLALGPLLAALGSLLVALGPLLAALGPLLGHSWAALGRSWVILGPLWGALGLLLRVSWPLLGRS